MSNVCEADNNTSIRCDRTKSNGCKENKNAESNNRSGCDGTYDWKPTNGTRYIYKVLSSDGDFLLSMFDNMFDVHVLVKFNQKIQFACVKSEY